MVQIVGKYKLVSSENFEEFLKAVSQKEETGRVSSSKPILEIKQNGDQWTITVDSNGKVTSSTFKLGEAYDEAMPSVEFTLKSVTRKEGDNKFITETVFGDKKSYRVYEFSDKGMTVQLSSDSTSVKASRTYERI